MLDAALRQLNQFGYDLDRMEFVGETEVLGQVRQEYERLTAGVTHVAELIRAGHTEEARKVQLDEIVPSADRLERLTNQLVNIAEADMVAAIETTEGAYGTSRLIVVSFAVGSILLALGLGYIISWSLVEPVKKIEARLSQIAAGDFAQQVAVANRDELGALAGNVNQTSERLGRLYQEVQARTAELARLGRRAGGARRSQQGRQFDARSRHGAEDDRGQGGSIVAARMQARSTCSAARGSNSACARPSG